MADRHHILVVDGDPVARNAITSYFVSAGFRVSEAGDGDAMWQSLDSSPIDLILFDIALPGDDGFALLRELRRTSEIAVIIVTARTETIDCVLGLELGANDYVGKPFNPRELLARAKNLIRLAGMARDPDLRATNLRFAGWTLAQGSRRLTAPSGEEVSLTRAEFDLLALLAANAGRAMTRDVLLDHVSHRDSVPFDRTIDVLVGRLRRKIEADPKHPRRLITMHGVGYMFVSD